MSTREGGDEPRALEIMPASALDTITRAEIDVQISTAKKYPRDEHKFADKLHAMATIDQEVAESCFYALKRTERNGEVKVIRGESVRLTELAASAFGNFRSGGRVIDETDEYIVAQGIAHDLESNNFVTTEIRRRITDRNGRRYNADMITLTANAACAIAVRNARKQVIGASRMRRAYVACLHIVAGNIEALGTKRDKAVAFFVEKGVAKERVLGALDLTGVEGFTGDHLVTLIGFKNAIEDGEGTLDDIFPPLRSAEEKSASEKLAADLLKGTNKSDERPPPAGSDASAPQGSGSEKKPGKTAQADLPGTKKDREPGSDG